MTFERCVQVIERAGGNLAAHASTVDLDSRVPTCPEWSVASLLTHQGMVHRWAASNLLLDDEPVRTETEVLATVPPAELLDWYRAGVKGLLQALQAADPDVPAQVFLNDAPAPRHFWARRQAHETTIHSVDALAAAQGRVPSAEEADVSREVALDGIDELLTGFLHAGPLAAVPGVPLDHRGGSHRLGPAVDAHGSRGKSCHRAHPVGNSGRDLHGDGEPAVPGPVEPGC
jgi:uncharacterized protein (TIGR03083 family)